MVCQILPNACRDKVALALSLRNWSALILMRVASIQVSCFPQTSACLFQDFNGYAGQIYGPVGIHSFLPWRRKNGGCTSGDFKVWYSNWVYNLCTCACLQVLLYFLQSYLVWTFNLNGYWNHISYFFKKDTSLKIERQSSMYIRGIHRAIGGISRRT